MLHRDYKRKLIHYRMRDDFFSKKYGMNYNEFQKADIIKKQNYSFEVESDAQEWELTINGLKTVEKKLRELLNGSR